MLARTHNCPTACPCLRTFTKHPSCFYRTPPPAPRKKADTLMFDHQPTGTPRLPVCEEHTLEGWGREDAQPAQVSCVVLHYCKQAVTLQANANTSHTTHVLALRGEASPSYTKLQHIGDLRNPRQRGGVKRERRTQRHRAMPGFPEQSIQTSRNQKNHNHIKRVHNRFPLRRSCT